MCSLANGATRIAVKNKIEIPSARAYAGSNERLSTIPSVKNITTIPPHKKPHVIEFRFDGSLVFVIFFLFFFVSFFFVSFFFFFCASILFSFSFSFVLRSLFLFFCASLLFSFSFLCFAPFFFFFSVLRSFFLFLVFVFFFSFFFFRFFSLVFFFAFFSFRFFFLYGAKGRKQNKNTESQNKKKKRTQ